ncbi:MAG: hypothetical protein DMG62_04185 [Acidobacteria bacterium]|nr:MAG: hypothetical protein DMG62_04185 [Acidobacteriota bacterium]
MAVGAQQHEVLWMIIRESLMLCLLGTLLGLPIALAGARFLKAMLFGLEPGDPISVIMPLLGIAAIAVAASFVPARRASLLNPIVALRCE